jgi:hypothetical protein
MISINSLHALKINTQLFRHAHLLTLAPWVLALVTLWFCWHGIFSLSCHTSRRSPREHRHPSREFVSQSVSLSSNFFAMCKKGVRRKSFLVLCWSREGWTA